MQNQMNQMSSFEFISILMSIIIGLGVTNLLAGAGRAFYRRRQNPMDEVHMLMIFLYPPDLSQEEEHRGRFQQNRAGYYSTFIAFCLLDITQTAIRGDLFHPFWYVPFVGQYAVLAGGGLVAGRRGYDRFFGWYLLITLLIWSLVVRRYLVGNTMV